MSDSSTSDDGTDSSNNGFTSRQPAVPAAAVAVSAARRELQSGDGDRAPKYAVLPTGTRVHRVTLSGVLTNIDLKEGDSTKYAEVHITDFSGDTVYCYPTQAHNGAIYSQVESIANSDDHQLPEWVVVVGKPSPFESNNGGDWLVSLDIEELTLVNESVIERNVQTAAENTLDMVDDYLEGSGDAEAFADKHYDNRAGKTERIARKAFRLLKQTSAVDVDLPDPEDVPSEAESEGSGEAEAQASA